MISETDRAALHKGIQESRPHGMRRRAKGTGVSVSDGQIMVALDQFLDLGRDLVRPNDRMVDAQISDHGSDFTVIRPRLSSRPRANRSTRPPPPRGGPGRIWLYARRICLKPCVGMGGQRRIYQLQNRRRTIRNEYHRLRRWKVCPALGDFFLLGNRSLLVGSNSRGSAPLKG